MTSSTRRDADAFLKRREQVLQALGQSALVLPSAPTAVRNNDVEHDYRQHSDLYYLTGFTEPDSVLVLTPGREKKMVLFVRPRDPSREVWDGARAGVEGAMATFGADEAFPIERLSEELPNLLEGCGRVYYELGFDRAFDDRFLAAVSVVRARGRTGVTFPTEFVSPAVILHTLRLIKSEGEIHCIREAAAISGVAHVEAMRMTRPGMYEYEVEGAILGIFRARGSERPAYGSIVGSGPNATVLHYRENSRRMEDGDLLLVDAGAEYGYYASDITRTFPVGGRFSDSQRAIYEVVLDAQEACIRATKPGATLPGLQEIAAEHITQGLIELGIIEGPLNLALKEKRYLPYYMHRVGHYLGMDVHDVGLQYRDGEAVPLEPGAVLTIEPGIYIAKDAAAPEQYRGIGVRIEDDVLVTPLGSDVLTRDVPKTVEEVEAACASRSRSAPDVEGARQDAGL